MVLRARHYCTLRNRAIRAIRGALFPLLKRGPVRLRQEGVVLVEPAEHRVVVADVPRRPEAVGWLGECARVELERTRQWLGSGWAPSGPASVGSHSLGVPSRPELRRALRRRRRRRRALPRRHQGGTKAAPRRHQGGPLSLLQYDMKSVQPRSTTLQNSSWWRTGTNLKLYQEVSGQKKQSRK